MMTNYLQPLFIQIARLQTEAEFRSQILPQISKYFQAKRSGLFFFDRLPLADPNFQKILKNSLSIERNPVVRYLVERHTPVHEALVTSPKTWKLICPRPDHWHVIAGPIVSNGQLIGLLGFTRDRTMPPFDSQNLADLSAVCLHLSTWVTKNRSDIPPLKKECLTPREAEIAELVARGLTNKEIGAILWITENTVKQTLKRMFRKLEVSSRAEMVAQLLSQKAPS